MKGKWRSPIVVLRDKDVELSCLLFLAYTGKGEILLESYTGEEESLHP